MSIVQVKTKGQLTLPSAIRKQMKLNVGDLLKVDVQAGKITLSPQTVIDRRLAESLQDFKAGRSHGPFKTTAELAAFLDKQTKKLK